MVKFEDSTTMLTLRLIDRTKEILTLIALTSAGLNNKTSFGNAVLRITNELGSILKDSQEMRDDFVDGKK